VDFLEQVVAVAERHGFGERGRDEILGLDEIEAGLFDGDDVGCGEDADVGHDRGRDFRDTILNYPYTGLWSPV